MFRVPHPATDDIGRRQSRLHPQASTRANESNFIGSNRPMIFDRRDNRRIGQAATGIEIVLKPVHSFSEDFHIAFTPPFPVSDFFQARPFLENQGGFDCPI